MRRLRPPTDRGPSATDSRPPSGPSAGAAGRGRRRPRGIERAEDRLDQAVVVDQGARSADEEAPAPGDIEVEDRLDLSSETETTRAVPPRRRIASPGLRSRAIIQPWPAFQKRWIGVATIPRRPGRCAAWASAGCGGRDDRLEAEPG